MLSRRTLFSGAALAVAAPVLAALPATTAAAAVPGLTVDLYNRRSGKQLYAHVTGLDRATGKWFFLAADGKTRVFPGSPAAPMTPLGASTGIPLGAVGTAKRIIIPAMDSGRVYFSVGKALKFFVNPGGGIVMPSVANPADANANVEWAFFELTLDANGVYANISFVDFVSLAMQTDPAHRHRGAGCRRSAAGRTGEDRRWPAHPGDGRPGRLEGPDRRARRHDAARAQPEHGRLHPRLDGLPERVPRPVHRPGVGRNTGRRTCGSTPSRHGAS